MKLNNQEGKTLLALRGGPTGSAELYERFPSGPSTSTLLKKGLIEQKGAEYHITALGREHCPTRRQAKAPAEKPLAVLLQEQSAKKVVSKPDTISITPVFNIVKAVPAVKVVPEKEPEMTTQPETKEKTKALQMLEAIEKFPGITSRQINLHLGFTVGEKFIPSYIERGLVILGTNDKNEKTYTLKEGYTAESVYATKGNTEYVKPAPVAPVAPVAPQVEQAKPAQDAFEIPSFLTDPQLDLDIKGPVQSAVDGKHIPMPAQSGSFRCAYTNDGCIILLGIYPLPIELDAKQSEVLMKFTGDMALSRTVAAEIENNVGAYLK